MPPRKVRKYFPILFSGVLAVFLFSFTFISDPLPRIIASFQRYLAELPEEKIYLHQDRQIYASGETIWFKAYLTQGPFHLPSTLSSTIYVELIDAQNQFIQKEIIYSPDGFGSGQLHLPDSLQSGTYLLRAYTQWMKNVGEEYFFQRPIKVLSEFSSPRPLAQTVSELDLQFFPEGGNLVEGILSKVAFKALDPNGLGKKIKGKIFEGTREIGSFESNDLGMGVFALLPEKGKTYTVQIEGDDHAFPLPTALESGLIMAVTNSPKSDEVVIKFLTSGKSPGKSVFLVAQSRGLVCATGQVDLSNQVAFVRIKKKEFPTGIAQLAALDEKGVPLAERLIFIDHQDHLQIKIITDKATYQPRERVRLDIEAKTTEGKPATANLSLSVVDAEQLEESEHGTSILTHLLLTSELKGHIEEPGYYFNTKNSDREEALDYLMLTQGWRKFTIKQASDGKIPEAQFAPERGISIQGILQNPKTGQAEAGGMISFLSFYPVISSEKTVTDTNGKFELRDLIFFDSTGVILEGKSKNNRPDLEILLENDAKRPSSVAWNPNQWLGNTASEQKFISESTLRKNINRAFDLDTTAFVLDGVEIRGRKIEEPNLGPRIYGSGTVNMQVAGNPALENLLHPLDLIKGRVAGVQVIGSGQTWSVIIRGVGSINSSLEPLILVDDIPVQLEFLHTIPVQEIERFSVWKGADTAIFGARGANGAIAFYTKKGNSSDKLDTQPLRKPNPKGLRGYQVEREFYSPTYLPEDLPSPRPDRRLTLFWAPMIQTDSTGKASVIFYNSDRETTIKAEAEGISQEGKAGKSNYFYSIKKDL
uniref:MG2 domain-containing protein n=1 Tax=Algoriphagus sp. TaxID=1872435 RepID=UPI002590A7F1|nr:MG2 domain-containing protein [Algoriphagus sp.]